MASTITLKAIGLNVNPNQLDLPEGSLTVAKNVIIDRDNVIEPSRGFALYGESMGSASDRAKQMWEYKDRIIRHYSSSLQFQNGVLNNGTVNFDTFNGSYTEPRTGIRIKKIDASGNLYFTTSDGIKKISAKTAEDFATSAGFITNAGGVKAVDFKTQLNVTPGDQTSFLPQDSAVAYRIVWATKDANENLIQGSPSQREEVYNSMTSLIVRDINHLLLRLDYVGNSGGSLVSDTNYVSTLGLVSTATALEARTALVSLATKIDEDILFANDSGSGAPLNIDAATSTTISGGVYTINFSSGTATDYFTAGQAIYLTGFTPGTSGTLNGAQTVATVSATAITINTSATGVVTVDPAAKIESGTYRAIVAPSAPDVPTPNSQLVDIQDYLLDIIVALQSEPDTAPTPVISSGSQSAYISDLDVTKAATVTLDITIPDAITSSYFYQIYRSSVTQATGTTTIDDLVPSDELQLVYEAFPTAAELTAKRVVVEDITPDEFRGANLYTNSATGEGILQANDLPPFAVDINRFKNVVFYANTRTRHRLSMSLLGVQNMIDDYGGGGTPNISIVSEDGTVNTYYFITGESEITDVLCGAGGTLAASGTASSFNLYSGEDETAYYVWYKIGTATDPAIANKTGIMVVAGAGDTAAQIATKTRNVLAAYANDFTAEVVTSTTVRITAVKTGYTTASTDNDTGFTITQNQAGQGENATNKEILLSSDASVGTAVDETARSLVRVLNANSTEVVNAYYTSSSTDVPGKFYLESRELTEDAFYLLGSDDVVGASFNPDISNTFVITNITTGTTPVVTTADPHNVSTGEKVILSLTDSTPAIDGVFEATRLTSTTFSISPGFNVTVGGTEGVGFDYDNSVVSENEQKKNRIYYSKVDQPEAVPLVNYLNVGDSDKEILRIFPLRDSLFVFKEDGLYRISGESAPFTLSLFDSSVILTAPDSLDVCNNVLFGLTTQGVTQITEGGTDDEITRPIESVIKRVVLNPNFKTLSFGIGYESDNSYTVWIPEDAADEIATIGYRYSTKTNSWTNIVRDVTCGFLNPTDDKLYMGAGDTNYIEQERKTFTRTDFADREYPLNLLVNNYLGTTLRFDSVSNIAKGDVIAQTQKLTIYEYNMLLKKLDLDPGVPSSDYYATLALEAGADLRTALEDLANKLDSDSLGFTNYASSIASITKTISSISAADPCVVTTSSNHGLLTGRQVNIVNTDSIPTINGNYSITVTGLNTFTVDENVTNVGTTGTVTTDDNSFNDIRGCYNIIVNKLNQDTVVAYTNYRLVDNDTLLEAIVDSVDPITKKVTVNIEPGFVLGAMTLYKSQERIVTWAPNQFGDPVNYKQLFESTIMFINKAFTRAELSFSTDLMPELIRIPFDGDGNGIFGHQTFGSGLFGGGSNGAPFRTYIPRQCQRCRYINQTFTHKVAREQFGIFGVSITGENTNSPRAYRR